MVEIMSRFFAYTFALMLIGLVGRARAQELEVYSHKLSCSTSSVTVWTTTPTCKVLKTASIPSVTEDAIKVYSAKNEYEPFLVVVNPTSSQSVNVSVGVFAEGVDCEIFQVKYINIAKATDALGNVGYWPDPLVPISNNSNVTLNANENNVFWVNIKVGQTVISNDYTANFLLGSISVPVKLHVFNFAISNELHVQSQMNFSHQSMLTKYGVTGTGSEYWNYVDKINHWFINHRLTPSNPLWPGGLTSAGAPYIDYDCSGTITDNDGIWGFEKLAQRYIGGDGTLGSTFTAPFNSGAGFPSFMAMTFKTNDPSSDQRPESFCGVARGGTWSGASASYNTKWFQYITAMQSYLNGLSYINKAYYYFANEPQDAADYDAIAWYARKIKEVAPNLKLMVSEGPRSEIYNNATHGAAKIDIWLPVLHEFDPVASLSRLKNNNEDSWIYFLKSTNPPYFNPITIDHPGIEGKLTGWFLYKYRLRGIAYYSTNNWGSNPWTTPMVNNQNGEMSLFYPPSESNANITYGATGHRFVSSIRFELLRDGFEDYEYLFKLGGNAQPQADMANAADSHVDKIIKGLKSYTRDDNFMYNLRRVIGLYLGGEISAIPDIDPGEVGQTSAHYINFQDLQKGPSASPLLVDGKEYQKVGWENFDSQKGYGWYAPNDAHWLGVYLTDASLNELQRSIIYSDYGRAATFVYNLTNGKYKVTVSVGWKGRSYKHNYIRINGAVFVNDEDNAGGYIVRTKTLDVTDGCITMEMGTANDYTMLNYIMIEPDGATGVDDPKEDVFSVNIYPNPSNGEINVIAPGIFSVSVNDIGGRLVRSITNCAGQVSFSVENLGLYLVKVIKGDVTVIRKVVVL